MIFGNYAKYYNLLYKDKNYQTEVDYIDALIKKYSSNKVRTILDLGCGTGNHALHFTKKGYQIYGIDLSAEMIKVATSKNIPNAQFQVGNVVDFNLKKKFDVVLSLFDVLCYQTSNQALEQTFKNIKKHLKKDGLFIFDCWYGPAVLTDKPTNREKILEDKEIKVTRWAKPVLHPNKNIVDVNFDLLIEDKKTGKQEKVQETHQVRYLFQPEIELLLEKYNLKLLHNEEFLTKKEPCFNTWKVCWIIKS